MREKLNNNIETLKFISIKGWIRFFLGITLSAVCVYFFLGSINQEQVLERFKRVDIFILFTAFVVTCLSYILRTIRWKYFFEDSQESFMSLYRALILGFFMNNVLPARIGELIRCHSLGTRSGQSRAFVLASVAAERLADGLTISAIFGLCFYFSNITGDSTFYISLVAFMFLLASIITILALLQRAFIFKILAYLDQKIKMKSFSFLITKMKKFVAGLEPILKSHLMIRVAFLSIVVWSVELFAYFLISIAFGEVLNLGELSLFLASVNFASLIPAAPGGVGVIESFAPLALNKAGINHETALAMVVAQHAIQYLVVGIPGIYFSIRKGK